MSEQILSIKDSSILLIKERGRKDIVIGAPHHTPGGVANMPCLEHPAGDENTGFIAHQIAEDLNLSSIIASNYRIDPNKNLKTDYSLQIAQWGPKYLIEIHGHGGKKKNSDNYCIEVSCGNMLRNNTSKLFATTLQHKFIKNDSFKTYKICGDFSNIHYQASKTATIIDERWIPIHIELPPSIRLNPQKGLPDFIGDFNNYLKETITEVCK